MHTIKNKLFFIFISLFILAISACDKNPIILDEDVPTINLRSPSSTVGIVHGDTIQIHAKISDNDELHEIEAFITRRHSGLLDTVWQLDTHSHAATYNLYGTYILKTEGAENLFELVVMASDHNENVGRKSLIFSVM